MTISLASTSRQALLPQRPMLRPDQSVAKAPMTRTIEVASVSEEAKLNLSQFKVPALPLFDNTFAALAQGSLLSTPQGEVCVEDLQPGDFLNTSSGEPAKVIWIGSSTFVPADPERRMPMIRIMADTFGPGRPSSFLTVGPAARLLQTPHHLRGDENNGTRIFSMAQEFVDGVNVIEICPPTPVRMFHVCLTRHAAINVGGMEMETYHPGSSATRSVSHSIRDLFLSMFPHISHVSGFGPLAHPRAPETT
jgi:hypothetical protein